MADDPKSGVSVTNLDANPRLMNFKEFFGGEVKAQVDTVEAAATDQATSTYRLVRIPSDACLIFLSLLCDALGGACAADIGLYRTAADGGAVVDVDCYGTAQTLVSAITQTASVNVAFEARDVANIRKQAWQDAGLATDPVCFFDVVLTLTADAAAAGTITVLALYTDGN